MIQMPVRFQQEGNELYPLPPDYQELTPEGMRLARVNACTLQETPEDLVHAWAFFRATYLFPLPRGQWYSNERVPSPAAHYRFVHDVGQYSRNIHVYLRSFAKTTLIDELNLLWANTRPYTKVLIIKSHDDFVKESLGKLSWQLEENERLIADFGSLKPPRGKGSWSKHQIWCNNGFQLTGKSIMGKLPGLRPWMIWIDDAEFDPKMRISPSMLTEQLERTVIEDIVPMLDIGAALNMVGTLHTRKFFLYYAATVSDADDDRFSFFNKVVMGGRDEHGELLWKEKFSEDRLEELRIALGPSGFAAQIMNDPGTESERLLYLHPKLGYHTVENADEFLTSKPLDSKATLWTWIRDKTEGDTFDDIKTTAVKRPFGEVVSGMYRILVADPIRRPSSKSDFACVMVIGIENNAVYKDTWRVLDVKLGRVTEQVFIEWIWQMGCKWFVRVCGVEAVSIQRKLVERIAGDFAERSVQAGWSPRVFPVTYKADFKADMMGAPAKAKRISRLVWRFEQHRLTLPRHLVRQQKPDHKLERGEHPRPWQQLSYQIENFTEDLRLLQHDDAIDTLAMPAFVVSPRGNYAPPPDTAAETDLMALLEQGKDRMPGMNVPIMGGMNMSDLTPAALDALNQKRFRSRDEDAKKRKIGRMRGRRRLSALRW